MGVFVLCGLITSLNTGTSVLDQLHYGDLFLKDTVNEAIVNYTTG